MLLPAYARVRALNLCRNASDSFADVDMASEMKSRLSGAGFVVIGAQDLSVLGRAAAPVPAPATSIVEI